MAKLKFTLNSSRKYKNGEYPLFLRISHKKSKTYISLKKTINKDFWDAKSGSIIINTTNKHTKRNLQILQLFLEEKMVTYKSSLFALEMSNPNYTLQDIINTLKYKNSSANVLSYFESVIKTLKETGKTGNAKVYANTFSVFSKYRNNKDLTFDELDYRVLKRFEEHMQYENLRINTISFYMRTIRALYNRAIKEGLAKEEMYPFKQLSIKHEKTSKRALLKSHLTAIKGLDLSKQPDKDMARDFFLFSYYCRGMAFVDLAYLKVENIVGDRLYYSRNKTNQKFSIKITEPIKEIMLKYNDLKKPETYIFPIIKNTDGDIYTQYR
ncbi:MAG: site-specific integrase, partial [Prolixibacteraceae bacterium]|nr:site-specific integrase [Prolixibacteraceae bacterium]